MGIEAGQHLLNYRLVEEIGRGGMGVVWKAIDTTLDREVAIKILPDALADDPQRLARFEREAKVLAALGHPNVAAVYGFHDAGGTRFLAMEWLPGDDLAVRLQSGPLEVDETVALMRQIASALEAAHARRIVHRDLKPANIRVAPDGAVKVLDFGLAKTMLPDMPPDSEPSRLPTMTAVESVVGALLGTAPYMSPEQVRGGEVDPRTDIWAFGCVFWECLTGRRLFGGTTTSDTLGAILHVEPEWERLPAETPSNLRRLLRRCLAKNPSERYHHIADARIDLETDPEPQPAASSSRGKVTAVALAIALVAAMAAVFSFFVRPESGPGKDNPLKGARFTRITDFPGSEFDAALSPDGRFVAFASDRDGSLGIYVGQTGGRAFRKLADYEFGPNEPPPVRSVGFSADGSEVWLGGSSARRLQLVPLLGGTPRGFLSDDVVNVEWSPDGKRIVYHSGIGGDPVFVADRTGANSRLIVDSDGALHQHYPIWSVDGNWIYLVRGRPSTLEMDLWRVRPDGTEAERLTERQLDVRYPTPLDDRTVLYSARDVDGAGPWLWALDIETRTSRRVTIGLERYGSVSASADRRSLVATRPDPRRMLWRVPILDPPANERDAAPYPALESIDAAAPRIGGAALYFLSSRGSGDGLWRVRDEQVSEIWRGSETALLEPVAISPDGESVALLLRTESGWHLHALSADGAQLEVVSTQVDARGAADWSPDGKWIVVGGEVAGAPGLYKIPLTGDAPERIADGEVLNPIWSPDGGTIVYEGPMVEGDSPVLAVRVDGTPIELPEISVSTYGERVRFLPDGSGLVYLQSLRTTQEFWLLDLETLVSRPLARLDASTTILTFDITADGKQIVFDRKREHSDVVLIELE